MQARRTFGWFFEQVRRATGVDVPRARRRFGGGIGSRRMAMSRQTLYRGRMSPSALPSVVEPLFKDSARRDRRLSVELPAGRLVFGDEGADEAPALWLSDQPAAPGIWARLRAEHRLSGLWPLLLAGEHYDRSRPWSDGELWPGRMSAASTHSPGALLQRWWHDYTSVDEDHDGLSAPQRLAVTAPFGDRWPGLLIPQSYPADVAADAAADAYAAVLLDDQPDLRVGLVAADRGADALGVAGWMGAANYTNDTGELCGVLRDWEQRFGVRVVGAGFAELYLSVAVAPANLDEAIRVAAEHFAFCPDNIWQGHAPQTLIGYAQRLLDANRWTFWWD